jgi:cytochrome b
MTKLPPQVGKLEGYPKMANQTVPVWDRFVRFFHWSLVGLIVSLFVSAHMGKQEIHHFLGFSLAALVIGRLVWGLVGSGHARFRSFVTSPARALRYIAEIGQGHPARYLGHNPAGAWMVIALLGAVLLLLGTGFVLQATLEFDGPLVALFNPVDDQTVHRILKVHDLALNVLYVLVPLHLLGVALASRQHKENLVLAMITGYKPLKTEN